MERFSSRKLKITRLIPESNQVRVREKLDRLVILLKLEDIL